MIYIMIWSEGWWGLEISFEGLGEIILLVLRFDFRAGVIRNRCFGVNLRVRVVFLRVRDVFSWLRDVFLGLRDVFSRAFAY